MTQEVLQQQVRKAFLEAEKSVAEKGGLVEMVVPSADGPELYHINVLGPGEGVGNVHWRAVHEVLRDMYGEGSTDLKSFIDNFQPESILPDQHLEWSFLSKELQRPLILEYDPIGIDLDKPAREFWSIRTVRESERGKLNG